MLPQRSASSSSTESVTKKAVETTGKEISKSMIVLHADPEPEPQKITKIIVSTIKTKPTATLFNNNNWANFGSSGGNAAPPASSSSMKADAGLDLLSLDLIIPCSASQSTAQHSLPSSNEFSNKEVRVFDN